MTTPRLQASGEQSQSSLYATSHEHHDRIMPHVDALPALAEMIDSVERDEFARRFEERFPRARPGAPVSPQE